LMVGALLAIFLITSRRRSRGRTISETFD